MTCTRMDGPTSLSRVETHSAYQALSTANQIRALILDSVCAGPKTFYFYFLFCSLGLTSIKLLVGLHPESSRNLLENSTSANLQFLSFRNTYVNHLLGSPWPALTLLIKVRIPLPILFLPLVQTILHRIV